MRVDFYRILITIINIQIKMMVRITPDRTIIVSWKIFLYYFQFFFKISTKIFFS